MHSHVGFSAGVNRYQEYEMQLLGPEMGLHPRITGWHVMPQTQLEADVLVGKQRYTSTGTGNMNGVTNLETRWRGLVPLFGSTSPKAGFSSGVAVHTLWNDMRGRSSTGHGGYERSAVQLWLPVRWASGDVWELDAGLLIYGRHISKLSQVNSANSDVTNIQNSGQYAQISMNLMQSNSTIKPFVRYTHLANSNVVRNSEYDGLRPRLEPESRRWQIGAVWEFNTP